MLKSEIKGHDIHNRNIFSKHKYNQDQPIKNNILEQPDFHQTCVVLLHTLNNKNILSHTMQAWQLFLKRGVNEIGVDYNNDDQYFEKIPWTIHSSGILHRNGSSLEYKDYQLYALEEYKRISDFSRQHGCTDLYIVIDETASLLYSVVSAVNNRLLKLNTFNIIQSTFPSLLFDEDVYITQLHGLVLGALPGTLFLSNAQSKHNTMELMTVTQHLPHYHPRSLTIHTFPNVLISNTRDMSGGLLSAEQHEGHYFGSLESRQEYITWVFFGGESRDSSESLMEGVCDQLLQYLNTVPVGGLVSFVIFPFQDTGYDSWCATQFKNLEEFPRILSRIQVKVYASMTLIQALTWVMESARNAVVVSFYSQKHMPENILYECLDKGISVIFPDVVLTDHSITVKDCNDRMFHLPNMPWHVAPSLSFRMSHIQKYGMQPCRLKEKQRTGRRMWIGEFAENVYAKTMPHIGMLKMKTSNDTSLTFVVWWVSENDIVHITIESILQQSGIDRLSPFVKIILVCPESVCHFYSNTNFQNSQEHFKKKIDLVLLRVPVRHNMLTYLATFLSAPQPLPHSSRSSILLFIRAPTILSKHTIQTILASPLVINPEYARLVMSTAIIDTKKHKLIDDIPNTTKQLDMSGVTFFGNIYIPNVHQDYFSTVLSSMCSIPNSRNIDSEIPTPSSLLYYFMVIQQNTWLKIIKDMPQVNLSPRIVAHGNLEKEMTTHELRLLCLWNNFLNAAIRAQVYQNVMPFIAGKI